MKDTIQNLMYMRLIGNISREFQRGRLYHPLRIQMTVVKVCTYIYISCTDIENLCDFHSEKTICVSDLNTIRTKIDSFHKED